MTIKEASKRYSIPEDDLLIREDGRIEWICDHGVGHTIYAPPVKQRDGSMFRNYVHGCDGCCSKLNIKYIK